MAQRLELFYPLELGLMRGAITPLQAWELDLTINNQEPLNKEQAQLVNWLNLVNQEPDQMPLQ